MKSKSHVNFNRRYYANKRPKSLHFPKPTFEIFIGLPWNFTRRCVSWSVSCAHAQERGDNNWVRLCSNQISAFFVRTRCIILYNLSHPRLMSRLWNSINSCTTAWQYCCRCYFTSSSIVCLLPLHTSYLISARSRPCMTCNWSNDLSSIRMSVLQSLHDGALL